MPSLWNMFRSAGLGRLLYHAWHRPLAPAKSILSRGPLLVFRAAFGRRQMVRAAAGLPAAPFPPAPADWPRISFMTGGRHWHQTVFCARSLEYACQLRPVFEILDDGSFDAALAARFHQLFPGSRVVGTAEGEERLHAALPPLRYPELHRARSQSIMMRKLLDLRAGRAGWHLYLDSDMLFFSTPDLLLRWFASPHEDVFLDDMPPPQIGVFDSSLGYIQPRALIEAKLGAPVLPLANAGLVGTDDASLDWDRLEHACGVLRALGGPQHLLEQTLTAFHLATRPATRLPRSEYRCLYLPESPGAARLVHYLYRSKDLYESSEWRRWLQPAGARRRLSPALIA